LGNFFASSPALPVRQAGARARQPILKQKFNKIRICQAN
jgi:hypothetical protein